MTFNKCLKNKLVILISVLNIIVIGLDPVYTRLTPFGDSTNSYSIWILQNTSLGAMIYYACIYITPFAYTGLIFLDDLSSGIDIKKISRYGRFKYQMRNILIPSLIAYIGLQTSFLLNIMLSDILYPGGYDTLESWYYPNEGTFSYTILDKYGFIPLEIFYTACASFYEALLCAFYILFQMMTRIRNLCLSAIASILAVHAINYLLDSNERWMYYSANITVQPASSYALKHIISFSDLGLSFFIWIFLELLMYVVVGYRNKNYV